MKKKNFLVFLLIAVLLIPTTAFGASKSKKITAYINSVKVFVSGKLLPADTIVYNGKVYVNANDVSKATNLAYSWDKKNNKVYLGEKPVDLSSVKTYKDGIYLVNKDIEPGLYRVVNSSSSFGYISRSSSVDMSSESVIANEIFAGDGYVELLSSDVAVKLSGAIIYKLTLQNMKRKSKQK